MAELRARMRQLEKRLGGGNGGHSKRRLKIYIGEVCPDVWPPETNLSIEEQLDLVEIGVRFYLCFEDEDQAMSSGIFDAEFSSFLDLDQGPANIDISSN